MARTRRGSRREGLRVIAGDAGGLALVAPKGGAARPTTARVKESLFGALGPDRLVGASLLDLYAGSRALAIQALSRGAAGRGPDDPRPPNAPAPPRHPPHPPPAR